MENLRNARKMLFEIDNLLKESMTRELDLLHEITRLRKEAKELEAKLETLRDASTVFVGTVALGEMFPNYREKLDKATHDLAEALAAKEGKIERR